MIPKATQQEMEEMLGQVPTWMEGFADSAVEHSWGLLRDLEFGEDTALPAREKALVALGAAAAISCPYCTYFHTEEARMSGVDDEELREAVNVASSTKYFSTILHGNEVELDSFRTETDEMVTHIKNQQAAAADD